MKPYTIVCYDTAIGLTDQYKCAFTIGHRRVVQTNCVTCKVRLCGHDNGGCIIPKPTPFDDYCKHIRYDWATQCILGIPRDFEFECMAGMWYEI